MNFPSNLRIEEERNLPEDGMISYRPFLYFSPTFWHRHICSLGLTERWNVQTDPAAEATVKEQWVCRELGVEQEEEALLSP